MALRKVIVTGGNGFVGSQICRRAVKQGANVVAVCRSGQPPKFPEGVSPDWVEKVEWVKGDALEPNEWKHCMKDADAVVACVGGFGSHEVMERVCGDANIHTAIAAREMKVPQFAFISAKRIQIPLIPTLLRGYYAGKNKVEVWLQSQQQESGEEKGDEFRWKVLKPGFVSGTRHITTRSGTVISIPLWIVGEPLKTIFTFPILRSLQHIPIIGHLFLPAVSTNDVANTIWWSLTHDDVQNELEIEDIIDLSSKMQVDDAYRI